MRLFRGEAHHCVSFRHILATQLIGGARHQHCWKATTTFLNALAAERKSFFHSLFILEQMRHFYAPSPSSRKVFCISHWGKNPQFIQKFTFWEYYFSQNSQFQNLIFDKVHNFKVSFFTKFTFWESHLSQNSHFQSLFFHKIQILKISNS